MPQAKSEPITLTDLEKMAVDAVSPIGPLLTDEEYDNLTKRIVAFLKLRLIDERGEK